MVDNVSCSQILSFEVSGTVLRDACSLVSSTVGSRDGCPGLWWMPEAAISALSPYSEVDIRDILERQRLDLGDYVWNAKMLYAGHGVKKLEMVSLYPK